MKGIIYKSLIANVAAILMVDAAAAREIYVAVDGNDQADGSATRPFRTLERAKAEVRRLNRKEDVTVIIGGGTYRLSAPLRFRPEDGGQGGTRVTWRAAEGAQPVLSGGDALAGWTLIDREKNIWMTSVPVGTDARQLYLDGALLRRASAELDEGSVTYNANGATLSAEAAGLLTGVDPKRLEMHLMATWSSRNIPVKAIDGNRLIFEQPAWYNSYTNNDTITTPHGPGHNRAWLVGACPLLATGGWGRNTDAWCIEPEKGRIYIRGGTGIDPNKSLVVLPQLEALISISGDTKGELRDFTMAGLQFSYTTWMAPSTNEGYADLQTGAYVTGPPIGEPAPFGSCFSGCRAFEAKREHWNLIPAAVQVSRARNVTLRDNQFSQLGQVALGVGNDGGANLSGVDLGAKSITVEGNRFAVASGGAIIAGGVRADAHHPSSDALRNSDLTVRNNIITNVALDFRGNAAVFVSYFDGARIENNDISNTPYTGIAIGWAWGHNDVGGTYGLAAERGRYEFQPRYTTPTINQNIKVLRNRLVNVSRDYLDGGGVYTLSAIPGNLIAENYIRAAGGASLYTDQGSKFIRMERNVVDTMGLWLHSNNGASIEPTSPGAVPDPRRERRWMSPRTTDNLAVGNWHNSIRVTGDWIPALRNIMQDNVLIPDGDWPPEAIAVIAAAGVSEDAVAPDRPK